MGGYALGVQQAEQDRARQFARRDQLSDEDRKQKAGDYVTARNNALTNLPNLKDLYGEDSQQYKDALQTIQQSQYNLGQLYHPDKAPGALQKDWHWLLGKMHGITSPKNQTPASITTQAPAFTIPPSTAPFTTPDLPAYQQTTPVLSPKGEPQTPPPVASGSPLPVWNTGGKGRIGSVTTQEPGVPSRTFPAMPAAVPKGATPTMAVAKPKGLVEAGNIPIWNRPSVLNDDGTHSSELSISMQDDKGNEVLIPLIVNGKFLTPDGKMPPGTIPHNAQEWDKASPEWKALRMQAWKHYEQTGQHLGKFDNPDDTDAYAQVLHNRGSATANAIPAGPPVTVTKASWGQAQVLKQKAAAMQKAQQEAGLLAAGAPLSQGQKENALLQSKLQAIQADPQLSPEDKAEARRHSFGVSEKPNLKMYASPDGGTKAWLDASRPDTIPVGWTAYAASNADTNKRADFEEYKKKYKESTGKDYPGTFESWTTEQSAQGRATVLAAKPANRDDRYIGILQKQGQGQPLTPDELAYKGAYDLWVQQTKVAPGVARMAAMNNDRYTWVYDLNDPDKNLKPMRMIDAMKAPVGTPQNIAFKTDAAITKAFTSGAPAQTINYFTTAIEHLKLLQQATDALNNGNTQLFNSLANKWATATGNPAPNNFDTVRNAVSGELSKTFKGTGATNEEIGLISRTINNTQSPDQLYGGIDYDLRLMGGKMQALQGQYAAGKEGKPNFPGTTTNTPQGKGSRSIAAAMALPVNRGKSADEVQKHLESLGYTVTKP